MHTVIPRGGIPCTIEHATTAATVEEWHWADAPDIARAAGEPMANMRCSWMEFEVTGASQMKLYFTPQAAAADWGIEIGMGEKWSGPVEAARFFTKGALASSFRATLSLRVGG